MAGVLSLCASKGVPAVKVLIGIAGLILWLFIVACGETLPEQASKEAIEEAPGLGIKANDIEDTFKEGDFEFEDAPLQDGTPRRMGSSPDGFAVLELIGPKSDLKQITLAVSSSPDAADFFVAYTSVLMLAVFPEWGSDGIQWLHESSQTVLSGTKERVDTTRGDIIVSLSYVDGFPLVLLNLAVKDETANSQASSGTKSAVQLSPATTPTPAPTSTPVPVQAQVTVPPATAAVRVAQPTSTPVLPPTVAARVAQPTTRPTNTPVPTATSAPTAEPTVAPAAPAPTATSVPTPAPTNTPEPTATPRPAPTFTPAPTPTPASVGLDLRNPYPTGSVMRGTDGTDISVVGINTNAWPVVQQTNQFNDPPDAGNRYYMVRVEVVNVSGGDALVVTDADFGLIGDNRVVYKTFQHYCGVIPDNLFGEMYEGGRVQGNLCFEVGADEGGFVLVHSPGFFSSDPRFLSVE